MDQRPNYKSYNCKTLRREHGVNFHDLGLGNGFLTKTAKAQTTKERNKLDFINIKNFVH